MLEALLEFVSEAVTVRVYQKQLFEYHYAKNSRKVTSSCTYRAIHRAKKQVKVWILA